MPESPKLVVDFARTQEMDRPDDDASSRRPDRAGPRVAASAVQRSVAWRGSTLSYERSYALASARVCGPAAAQARAMTPTPHCLLDLTDSNVRDMSPELSKHGCLRRPTLSGQTRTENTANWATPVFSFFFFN